MKSNITNKTSNKNFGITFFVVFILISIYVFYKTQIINYYLIIIALAFLILGLINSKILSPLNNLWFKFGILLGKIVSPIVMGVIFFAVVTPIGIIMKLLKKNLLNLNNKNQRTYWIVKKTQDSTMKNQF